MRKELNKRNEQHEEKDAAGNRVIEANKIFFIGAKMALDVFSSAEKDFVQ